MADIGCIDPHGMYPFPKDRESCPKCQAIRAQQEPSLRHGLPYGWWKNPDVWAGGICLLLFAVTMLGILAAWFLDWKPFW